MPLITQIHQQRCKAIEKEKAQGKTPEEAAAVAMVAVNKSDVPSDHDRAALMAALENDRERLGEIEDVEEKIKLKKDELFPKYLPHVDVYIDSGAQYPNPLLVWCAIWAVDIGDLHNAMRLSLVAIKQQQLAPENFKRDLPTYMAEAVAEWAERQLKAGLSGSPYIDHVCALLTEKIWPTTNVIVLGKVFKVAGQLAEANKEFKEALALYERAQAENEKAGCKGRIKELKARLDDKG